MEVIHPRTQKIEEIHLRFRIDWLPYWIILARDGYNRCGAQDMAQLEKLLKGASNPSQAILLLSRCLSQSPTEADAQSP